MLRQLSLLLNYPKPPGAASRTRQRLPTAHGGAGGGVRAGDDAEDAQVHAGARGPRRADRVERGAG